MPNESPDPTAAQDAGASVCQSADAAVSDPGGLCGTYDFEGGVDCSGPGPVEAEGPVTWDEQRITKCAEELDALTGDRSLIEEFKTILRKYASGYMSPPSQELQKEDG